MSSDPPPENARPPHPEALPAGSVLGDFELRGVVAAGGFGIVYRAFDPALEREVAIKEYMPSALAVRGSGPPTVVLRSAADADLFALGLRSFVNEARLLARFDHPSLVKVYRFWEQHGTAYMVMPLYRGRTLKDVCEAGDGPVDEAALLRIVLPVLGALELLHEASVYHRDVAPDNILLGDDGVPVLLDFGAARRVVGEQTQRLTAILKPRYAPIEQYADVANLPQGPWTDLYALAAVMRYVITGVAPLAAAARAVDDQLAPLAATEHLRFGLPLRRAVDWGLALRPQDRPQDAAALRAALEGRIEVPPPGQATAAPLALPPVRHEAPAARPAGGRRVGARRGAPRAGGRTTTGLTTSGLTTSGLTASGVMAGSAAAGDAEPIDATALASTLPMPLDGVRAVPPPTRRPAAPSVQCVQLDGPAEADGAASAAPETTLPPLAAAPQRVAPSRRWRWIGAGVVVAALTIGWWPRTPQAPQAATAASVPPTRAPEATPVTRPSAPAAAAAPVPAMLPAAATATPAPRPEPAGVRTTATPATVPTASAAAAATGATAPSAIAAPATATPAAATAPAATAAAAPPAAAVAARRPAEPARPGAAEAEAASPDEACSGRMFIARALCVQRECTTPRFREHPHCVRIRQDNAERQQRIAQP